MKRFESSILPIIAFVSGFSLMTFELAAARVLAPSIGSSTYVWTSVIGVIIAALSVGYWAGGKMADVRNRASDIVWLCLTIAATVLVVMMVYPGMLEWVTSNIVDARVQGVVASFLLFAPTSFLLGILAPYLVKLKITTLETSGSSFASLSAMESIGGITGTFITGFILFGFIGARETFAVVVLLLVASSWLLVARHGMTLRLTLSLVMVLTCLGWLQSSQEGEIDTPSAHYSIIEGMRNGRAVRGLTTGPQGVQSGVYVDAPGEPVFWYTKQMIEIVELAPAHQNILVLGGGTFTLPSYLAEQYPDSTIDVVEIDPELAEIAREHFYYTDPANVNLIFQDARTFVNETSKKYDVIVVDVYSDASVPFSLMTREYGEQLTELAHKKTIVAANMIVGDDVAVCREQWQAFDAPYRAHFDYAAYTLERPTESLSNIVVTYTYEPFDRPEARALPFDAAQPFTDNYTPAERLHQSCRTQIQRQI